ncbi:MAG: exodeoxyribonuclease V subunit gamma [Kiritimatiellae bacterium]|nr:exodeoxyribonuclease V subunit gamma [Kiritimatiellia bacterium]
MNEMGEAMKLVWAQRVEDLAEGLYGELERELAGDPFARAAVVVGHRMRGEWLKEFHVFSRAERGRMILAGMDVVELHPFVGDWLYAALEGKDPKRRRPSSHPYSMEVLRWRIDRLLGEMEGAGELGRGYPALARYLERGGKGAGASAEGRRAALAGKLAAMYGDYQAYRPEMLSRWEKGALPGEEPDRWEASLWRALRAQGGESLKDQFVRMAAGADLGAAFAHGIPRYRGVHVFGVSSMPRPYAAFFERLSEVVPVTVHAFNPSRVFWMDDPDWRQAWRIAMDEAGAGGKGDAGGRTAAELLEELSHPLLGTLGVGCKGLLAELVDRLEGRDSVPEAPEEEGDSVLWRLQRQLWERKSKSERDAPVAAGDSSVEVHLASTARREMEVVRDGLLGWFAGHPGAHPRDAMVLCADWERYAPHAEAVFGGGAAGVPCTLLGRGAADDPVAEAFLALLELAGSRMEAGAVLDLPAEPSVGGRFGIGQGDLAALREFAKKANIRWGLDDGHVEEVMGGDAGAGTERRYAFTWRRGLDRLLLSALEGSDAGGGDVVQAGALGGLLLAGDAEGERAALLGRLCGYVAALEGVRKMRSERGTAEEWQNRFLRLVGDFFAETDQNHRSVAALREAVASVAARMREADAAAGGKPAVRGWEVFAAAVAEQVKGVGARAARTPDSVLFAPLRAGMPSPRRLVWVCGLNEGVFPRNPQRPAFDLMGKRPAPLDPSPRNDDALALLEAVCGAREKLALSWSGIDPHSGKEVPPAPLAGALLDYLSGRFAVEGREGGMPYARHVHPLQGFSRRYFEKGSPLPASYSEADRAAALAIAGARKGDGGRAAAYAYLPEGRGEIGLDELAEVFGNPSKAVLKAFAQVTDPKYAAIDSDDKLAVDPSPEKDPRLSLLRAMGEDEARRRGAVATETGCAPEPGEAARAIADAWGAQERVNFRNRPLLAQDCPACPVPAGEGANLLGMLEEAERLPGGGVPVDVTVDVPTAGGGVRKVRVRGRVAAVERRTEDGGTAWYAPNLTKYMEHRFRQAADWVRHLAANAAGLRMASVAVSGSATITDSGRFSKNKKEIQVLPPMDPGEASERLGRILALLCEPFPGAVPFHPDASAALASAAAGGTLEGPVADRVREALRAAWGGGWVPDKEAAERLPGRPGRRPEDAALWPESPAVLPDGCMEKFASAACAFWAGCPYISKKPRAAAPPRGAKGGAKRRAGK